MKSHLFSKAFLTTLFTSGAWYTRALWVLIVVLWLFFVMLLVDVTAY